MTEQEWKEIETGIDDEDGTVEDLEVETFYGRLDTIMSTDSYFRVIADNGGSDLETRIPYETLKELGWAFVGVPSEKL